MLENFRQKIVDFRNKMTSDFVFFNEPERGVEFEFIFGGEYDPESWEKVFSELEPNNCEALKIIVDDALGRTQEERDGFVRELTFSKKGLLVTKDARDKYQKKYLYEQFLININSLSQTNLSNMHQALENLE